MKLAKRIFLAALPFAFWACSKDDSDELTPPIPDNNGGTTIEEVELLTPIDAQATESAKKLYTYFRSVYGEKTFSSTMANVSWNTKEVDHVYKLTGKYPAMNGFDFIHIHHSPADWIDYSDISPVKNWADAGGLVSLMWHFSVPDKEGTHSFYAEKTDFKPSNIFVEGSSDRTFFYKQLDNVCNVILKLQDNNIAALWRPFHEASKGWFWWGTEGSDVYVRLWKLMYDYMQQKGIHNLIWVWTTEGSDSDWYPGDEYVDIVGRDLYGKNASENYNEWNAMKAKYDHKMLALSECGNLLEGRTIISKQALIGEQWSSKGVKWLYFMPWYDYDFNKGLASVNVRCSDEFWINAMSRSYVINRNDVKKYFSEVKYKQ